MAATEIAPGLLRWTAPHPDWSPEKDWDELVGSVLYELEEVVVLIDPLLPREGREEFLHWLDGRIGSRGVSILTTIRWHRRDRRELAERYRPPAGRAWNTIPHGVEYKPLRGAGEALYWLVRARALVVGDSVVGQPEGGLRLCPEEWLAGESVDRRGLAGLMRPLLELPVERVLVSHGRPVLRDGRAALARAIDAAAEGR